MENRVKGFFPLYIDLSRKKIVVIGGGQIASRRVRVLLDFCQNITVIAPEVTEELKQLAEKKAVLWKQKAYEREELYDADLVLACTDDAKLNGGIYSVCKCLGILVNDCSDQEKCDFQFPSVLVSDEVVIGFNAAGKDHRKVREMRRKVQEFLGEDGVYEG